ncbi:unnamed protein product [Dovyalis caffra]|uniref:Uncharacterized protein n=1 Tax=Dovyalis caffra TaxID=77055 RepID=A0AAV1SUS6_9ROSI|nr:unnamed protein product [Dovyalis caffra]
MASDKQSYRAGEAQGRAEEKTGRVTDTMKEKARDAKDKTSETTQQAKEKTSQKAQDAREKSAETTESAEQKAQESKEKTKGVLEQTEEKVMQMAESAKDTVKHTLGMGGPGEDEDIYTRRDETEDPAGYKNTTTHKETKLLRRLLDNRSTQSDESSCATKMKVIPKKERLLSCGLNEPLILGHHQLSNVVKNGNQNQA